MTKALQAIGAVVVLLAVAAACTTTSPSPSPSATPLPSNPNGIPAGQPTSIDLGVGMSDDNRIVTLRFIGGVLQPPGTPCSTEYEGWAMPDGDVLQVAVVRVLEIPPDPGAACPAAGQDREVQVELDEPFLGAFAKDWRSANLIPVERQSN